MQVGILGVTQLVELQLPSERPSMYSRSCEMTRVSSPLTLIYCSVNIFYRAKYDSCFRETKRSLTVQPLTDLCGFQNLLFAMSTARIQAVDTKATTRSNRRAHRC